jgi:hypothetical protein
MGPSDLSGSSAEKTGRLHLFLELARTRPVLAGVVFVAVIAAVAFGRYTKRQQADPPPAPVAVVAAAERDRGVLVNMVIRQKVMDRLRDGGMSRADARRQAFEVLQDETINVVAAEILPAEGPPQGSVIDWLIAHKDEILQIVLTLLSLLAMLA